MADSNPVTPEKPAPGGMQDNTAPKPQSLGSKLGESLLNMAGMGSVTSTLNSPNAYGQKK